MQELTEEMEHLKAEQEHAMALAVYDGMTKDEALKYEERKIRIYKLYDALYAQKGAVGNVVLKWIGAENYQHSL